MKKTALSGRTKQAEVLYNKRFTGWVFRMLAVLRAGRKKEFILENVPAFRRDQQKWL